MNKAIAGTQRGDDRASGVGIRERILIVEDSKGVRELIFDILTTAGYECRAVGSGREALAHLNSGESSIYYFAAWTDGGCLLGCDHEHQTVTEAVGCTSCAGGYVIAVENNIYRALNDAEEAEFQSASRVVLKPAELQYEEFGYAVMIRVCFVDGWGWNTWMRYETYEEAAAHAKEGNKIVPFGSAEWYALRLIREPALPASAYVPQENPPGREGETLVEFVCRIVPSPLDPRSLTEKATATTLGNARVQGATRTKTLIEFVLDWLDEWELKALKQIHSVLVFATASASASRRQVRKAIRRKTRTVSPESRSRLRQLTGG